MEHLLTLFVFTATVLLPLIFGLYFNLWWIKLLCVLELSGCIFCIYSFGDKFMELIFMVFVPLWSVFFAAGIIARMKKFSGNNPGVRRNPFL
jgi:hypothetical protein